MEEAQVKTPPDIQGKRRATEFSTSVTQGRRLADAHP
jgi:hypothetical protein